MAKELKIGKHRGDGVPPLRWTVLILDLAMQDAKQFLDDAQCHHIAEQVEELAREQDPSHPLTQRVSQVGDLLELKEKGGPLGKINARVFFILDKPRVAIVILGVIFKQNEGHTPTGARLRMQRRRRKYLAGEYGKAETRTTLGAREGEKGGARAP